MRPAEIEPVKVVVSVLSSETDAAEKALGALKRGSAKRTLR